MCPSYSQLIQPKTANDCMNSDIFRKVGWIRPKLNFDQGSKFIKNQNVEVGGTLTGVQQQDLKPRLGWLVGFLAGRW